jgi:hypothetical protein
MQGNKQGNKRITECRSINKATICQAVYEYRVCVWHILVSARDDNEDQQYRRKPQQQQPPQHRTVTTGITMQIQCKSNAMQCNAHGYSQWDG